MTIYFENYVELPMLVKIETIVLPDFLSVMVDCGNILIERGI